MVALPVRRRSFPQPPGVCAQPKRRPGNPMLSAMDKTALSERDICTKFIMPVMWAATTPRAPLPPS